MCRIEMPALPSLLVDIVLEGRWRETTDGVSFLLSDSVINGQKLLIFLSQYHYNKLCNSERIFCDGTFIVAPSLFQQLYIIDTDNGHKLFPHMFCLLPSKSRLTYVDVLMTLRDKAYEQDINVSPKCIVLDFESGFISTVSQELLVYDKKRFTQSPGKWRKKE